MSADPVEILKSRIKVYADKMSKYDVLGPDEFNRWDQYAFAIEAIEWAISDIKAARETTPPPSNPNLP